MFPLLLESLHLPSVHLEPLHELHHLFVLHLEVILELLHGLHLGHLVESWPIILASPLLPLQRHHHYSATHKQKAL